MTDTFVSRMRSADYHEGYWERGEGSNYVNYGPDPGWQPTVHTMCMELGTTGRWLEVACAKGWFVYEARFAGVDCWGIDISEYAIGQAPNRVRDRVVLGNVAEAIPWPAAAMDVVCSWEFLEHVYEDELDRVLREMERVLRPGGWLWHRIGIDCADDPRFAGAEHGHQNDVTHVLEMPDRWWRSMFDRRGWQHQPHAERALNSVFRDRDWANRFYVYRVGDGTATAR
jgi:SAM-dependent methyltransferase